MPKNEHVILVIDYLGIYDKDVSRNNKGDVPRQGRYTSKQYCAPTHHPNFDIKVQKVQETV